jgi:hypothetical protein
MQKIVAAKVLILFMLVAAEEYLVSARKLTFFEKLQFFLFPILG